jgi:transposase-like protein
LWITVICQVEAFFFLDHSHNPENNVAQSHAFTQERQKTRPDPGNARVEEENAFLKKATAYFAKQSK